MTVPAGRLHVVCQSVKDVIKMFELRKMDDSRMKYRLNLLRFLQDVKEDDEEIFTQKRRKKRSSKATERVGRR